MQASIAGEPQTNTKTLHDATLSPKNNPEKSSGMMIHAMKGISINAIPMNMDITKMASDLYLAEKNSPM